MWIARIHKKTGENIGEIIVLVKEFHRLKDEQKLKGADGDINRYKTTGDLSRKMTDVNTPEWLKTLNFNDEVDTLLITRDWTVYFPKSMIGSAACDMNDVTSWCTVRKAGGNLFLSYVGDPESTKMLYYVVSNDPKKKKLPSNWFSIGLEDGRIIGRKKGRETIDGSQVGLTDKRMRKEFKGDYQTIMDTIFKHHLQLGTGHPAKLELANMAQSSSYYLKKIKGLSQSDRYSLIAQMIKYPMTQTMIDFMFNNDKGFPSKYRYRCIEAFILTSPNLSSQMWFDLYKEFFEKNYKAEPYWMSDKPLLDERGDVNQSLEWDLYELKNYAFYIRNIGQPSEDSEWEIDNVDSIQTALSHARNMPSKVFNDQLRIVRSSNMSTSGFTTAYLLCRYSISDRQWIDLLTDIRCVLLQTLAIASICNNFYGDRLRQFRELMYDMDYTMQVDANAIYFIEDGVLDNLDIDYEHQRRN
jgi:hypothetical protein